MAVLPLVMTPAGLQPQAPADLRNQLVTTVATTNPDYTDNLPASLIEDVASTEVAGLGLADSFLVDLVNSVAPTAANPFILAQQGQLYGLVPQAQTNTSCFLVFVGVAGFVIVQGFTVSDGTYQYVCPDGGVIGAGNESLPIYAVANQAGTWAVPGGSVNQLVTSVPSEILNDPVNPFAVSNPEAGIPSSAAEDISDYHDRVMTAGLAASTGMSRYLKTRLANVPGVQARLVSVRQDVPSGRYIVIVGGGDPYQVAYQIWRAVGWTAGLLAAPLYIDGIDPTNPCRIHTTYNHNLTDQENVRFDDIVGTGAIDGLNGKTFTATIDPIDPTSFLIPLDATAPGSTYTSGGTITDAATGYNPIVNPVTITDWPDTYLVPYVIPQQEHVTMTVRWRTNSTNYVSQQAVAAAAQPAIVDYINAIPAGLTPISVYELESVFLEAVNDLVPAPSIILLTFTVFLNGLNVAIPAVGSQIVQGDPNSYFWCQPADITVQQA